MHTPSSSIIYHQLLQLCEVENNWALVSWCRDLMSRMCGTSRSSSCNELVAINIHIVLCVYVSVCRFTLMPHTTSSPISPSGPPAIGRNRLKGYSSPTIALVRSPKTSPNCLIWRHSISRTTRSGHCHRLPSGLETGWTSWTCPSTSWTCSHTCRSPRLLKEVVAFLNLPLVETNCEYMMLFLHSQFHMLSAIQY